MLLIIMVISEETFSDFFSKSLFDEIVKATQNFNILARYCNLLITIATN